VLDADPEQIAELELAILLLPQLAPVLRRPRGVEFAGQSLRERRLAGRFGADQADALDEVGVDDRIEEMAMRVQVAANQRPRNRDRSTSGID
jgi:hypothetical protein